MKISAILVVGTLSSLFSSGIIKAQEKEETDLEVLQNFQKKGIYYHVEGTLTTSIVDAGTTATLLPRNGGFRPFKGIRAKAFLGEPTTTVMPIDYVFGKRPVDENLHTKSVALTIKEQAEFSPTFIAECQKKLDLLGAKGPRVPLLVYGCKINANTDAKLTVTFDLAKYKPVAHLAKQTMQNLSQKWLQLQQLTHLVQPTQLATKTK